jgi:hypothetical protein
MLFMAGVIGYTIINYPQLSEGEGWGIVGMVGLGGFGILLFVIDIAIQNIFRKRRIVNIIGLIVAAVATVLIYNG